MMKEIKRYLVTAALPYANGPLHIGHLAGAYLSSDVYVRFLRLSGKDVKFICGSDEHGAAITIKSLKESISPQDIVDKYHELFKDTFNKIGVSFDIYHRTSSPIHHETSQDFFKTLYEKGEFIEKESEQYFDPQADQFLADRYITGTCPKCGNENAYGDQCENCGSSLSPTELINPKSTLSDATPELRKTKHWYLPLDKYENWLKEWINTGQLDGVKHHYPEDWKNHVLGQCKSWLENGLMPRAMTRDLTWGVDVPQDIEGAKGKKLYVWMDAPIGYISATKQWAIEKKEDWKKYWQDDESALIHFIGKDNIVFHCIIFPAILKAHGNYNLPLNVPANQFMNLEGDKISTSRNWAVWVHEYLEEIPGREDELRYALIKNMPEQKDSEFTWKSYQDSVNNELVNNLANFVNRVMVLTNKYYDGVIPEIDEDLDIIGCENEEDLSFHDNEMLRLFDNVDILSDKLRKFDFRGGLKVLMEISANGNQILQFNQPWKTIKEDPENVKVVMHLLMQYVFVLSVVTRPFLPYTSDRIRRLLALEPLKENGELLELSNTLSEGENLLNSGHKISSPEHLFTRIEDSVVETQVAKLQATKSELPSEELSQNNNLKDTIQYDDFIKMDLRAATIMDAKKVEKADKLLQLTLDVGFEKRTVVSGIAQHFAPDQIIGQKVTLLANLAPRKIRGVESKGMILMSENEDGSLKFVQPAVEAENGALIS
ncbi:MAG: methionine--tRNA ligase [Bacteroidia bacterium]|nr:methionine--tRNA ligase [Bacteroidia bacterium]